MRTPALILFLTLLAPLTGGAQSFTDPAHASCTDSSATLLLYSGRTLRGSKWGCVGALQHALASGLNSCADTATRNFSADGVFAENTRRALHRFLACRGRADCPDTVVTASVWSMMLPGQPLPSVHQRAFTLSLTFEATDYDRAEWNYGTRDSLSALTWGPFGATVGWGAEVRAVLRRVRTADKGLLPAAFGAEWPTARQLLDSAPEKGYSLLKSVWADTARRRAWRDVFARLGADSLVRACYDHYALGSDQWLRPALRRLATLIPGADTAMTEIDYAFMLDLAMQVSVKQSRIEQVRSALAALARRLKRPLTPAERRRVTGQTFAAASAWTRDRTGRNVTYYVEGIGGPDGLDDAERRAWNWRSGLRAGDLGLSDQRHYYPAWLLAQ